jgi:DNA replication and repair protein RecF
VTLSRVQVTDFRCLHAAELELDPQFTLISGPNASGKTSLLEAMYVLGRGRSFRTRRLEHLIKNGAERFVVFGEVESPNRRIPLGVEGGHAGIRAKIAGDKASSLAELAVVLPVQIIDPEVHRLIEEGPNRRRRFLDWGTFHVEQSAFIGHWQRYQQVLRQRNAALKSRLPRAVVSIWDAELLQFGELLNGARRRYVDLLAAAADAVGRNLLGMELGLSYRPGWAKDRSFAEALQLSWNHDQEAGATQVGPHRAELGIRLDGAPVKDRISRGQQKLLAATLLMAQVKLFPEGGVQPTLLLDDPAAELDDARLAGLIREVSAQSVQLVVTTLHGEFAAFGTPGRRYGVERGEVAAIG